MLDLLGFIVSGNRRRFFINYVLLLRCNLLCWLVCELVTELVSVVALTVSAIKSIVYIGVIDSNESSTCRCRVWDRNSLKSI